MFKLAFCVLFAVAAAKPDELFLTPHLTPLSTTYIAPATTTITKEASGFINQGPLLYSTPLGYAHYIKKRSAPLTYIAPTTYLAKPAVATYTSPLATYSAPIWPATLPFANAHFIKKRAAPLLATSYIAPTYADPLLASTTPLVSSSWIAPTSYVSQPLAYAGHFIK
ncbi:uncharacterized protein LOC115452920 [Manduca sexta]|uniref:uncharacterized protein LOC115452920 n=1 Tax=Manduca sexta TaxID=7130 RepID=UPI001890B4DC|nr:uncharacterized protein LOC115452920 [Manduca sexta]